MPNIDDDMLAAMKKSPMRVFDPQIVQDPLVYRLTEVRCEKCVCYVVRLLCVDTCCVLQAIMHYGEVRGHIHRFVFISGRAWRCWRIVMALMLAVMLGMQCT